MIPGASLRVLCVIDSMNVGGGAEQLIVSLLRPLSARGVHVDVAVLSSSSSDLGRAIEAAGSRIHRLDLKHRWAAPEAIAKLVRVMKREAYDVVWGHLYFGNLYSAVASSIARAPNVLTLHNSGEFQNDDGHERWTRVRNRIEAGVGRRFASKRIAVSRAVRDDYVAATGWRDIGVIHNGVPIASMPAPLSVDRRSAVRATLGAEPNDFLVTIAARLAPEKGHVTFVEALRLLAVEHRFRPKVAVFGQGPTRAGLEEKIRAYDLAAEVTFHGPVGQDRLFDAIMAADAFVLPSWREPFGIAAAEAMALGTPAIFSAVDGLLELNDGGAALAVPPRDPKALAGALLQLKDDVPLRAELAARGRARVRALFDIDAVATQWASAFRELANAS